MIETLQQMDKNCHAIVVGEDRVAYGDKAAGSWKSAMLKRLDLDESRLHFTGLVSRPDMVNFLRASNVHVYYTAPFVLSWSFLEAMSCGACIVASDVEPVQEFMTDGVEGRLVDMYQPEAAADVVMELLRSPKNAAGYREAARKRVLESLDAQQVIYPHKLIFLRELLG